MKMYTMPVKGGYQYKKRNFDGSFNLFYLTVEVLGETEKSYLIRISVPVDGHPAKSTMTVRKHNVRLHGMSTATPAPTPAPRRQHDYSTAWWNN
jgi:hypothetical protein